MQRVLSGARARPDQSGNENTASLSQRVATKSSATYTSLETYFVPNRESSNLVSAVTFANDAALASGTTCFAQLPRGVPSGSEYTFEHGSIAIADSVDSGTKKMASLSQRVARAVGNVPARNVFRSKPGIIKPCERSDVLTMRRRWARHASPSYHEAYRPGQSTHSSMVSYETTESRVLQQRLGLRWSRWGPARAQALGEWLQSPAIRVPKHKEELQRCCRACSDAGSSRKSCKITFALPPPLDSAHRHRTRLR